MPVKKCPVCGVSVKLENVERHLREGHPRARLEPASVLTREELRHLERERRTTARSSVRPTRRGLLRLAIVAIVLASVLALAVLNPFRGTGPAVGQIAPDFTLTTSTGERITLSSYRGTPVLLEFMDVDCPACQLAARESLSPLYANFSARVRFLSVDVNFVGADDTADRIDAFKAAYSTPWSYALDADRRVQRAYGVEQTPTTFILDQQGVVARVLIGEPPRGYADYAAALDEVLG